MTTVMRMPEGPECHRTAINLHARRAGALLTEVKIVDGRYKTHGPFQGYDLLVSKVNAQHRLKLQGVAAWGKLIVWIFEGDIYVHCTLGLKGGWSRSKRKHGGVCFVFDNGREWFNDQLHYGTIKVCDRESTVKKILSLGPDVCRPETGFTLSHFRAMVKKRSEWDIARLLMDQKAMAGLGNYLKSDVLYACCIHPCTPCKELGLMQQAQLHAAIVDLSVGHLQAYKTGTRMRKLVYGRKRDKYGNKVIKIKTGDKRNTHFVVSVQK